jgi:hypothetical protein
MPQVQTLSGSVIQSRKAETLNAQALRKTVAVRDLEIVNDNTVAFQGHRLEMTKDAFKQLIGMVGMSQAFAKKFEKLFDADVKARFINQMKNAMASQMNEITMVVSPISKKVVGFTKRATDLVSNERFIDLADQIIDQHGFEVSNWGVDANKGLVTINAFNPKAEFAVAGINDEVFKAGLTLRNSPGKGIEVMPYVSRMWCANGLTTPLAAESYQLQDLTQPSMEKFFQHMAELRKNGFQPQGFQELISKANKTSASMYELQRAHSMAKRHVGDAADNWIPLSENMSAYRTGGIEIDQFSTDELKNARSNQSIWSLTNGLTHIAQWAPSRLAFDMGDKESTQLMVDAGNILGKKWDLGAQVPNPWKTNEIDPSQQVGLWLN